MSDEQDPISRDNERARRVQAREHWVPSQYTIYGDYKYVPIQKDRQQEIQKTFDEIQEICNPTLMKLSKEENLSEIQDGLYRKFGQFEGQLNVCIANSKNVRDSNYCADQFINQMRTEGRQYTIDFLRQY